MLKDKIKAASVHLAISAFILSSFLILVFLIWYPSPYSKISGLKDLLIILVGIDLLIGPFLTLLVFKKNKASLKFDLSFIATVQLIALLYGAYTIYQGHPVYVVYTIDRFELISAKEALPENAKYETLKVSRLGSPTLVLAKMPEDRDIRNKILFDALSGLPDLSGHSEYYYPFDQHITDVLNNGLDMAPYLAVANSKTKLDAFFKQHGKTAADYAFLPLIGKEKDVIWAFSRETGQPVDIIDISPWKQG